ncbi:hypothetical protein ACNS7O_04345 [Haloferacaceae archaeon DSL9]
MRRIYESEALHRDSSDPFSPSESSDDDSRRGSKFLRHVSSRSMIDWSAASHALMPVALRNRAITVGVETNRDVYEVGEPVAFRVDLHNSLPVPVHLRTETPIRWRWAIDDLTEASAVADSAPDERALFSFGRSERKRFHRTWHRSFQRTPSEWEPAEPGTYELAVWVNVDDPAARGLRASTTFELRD